jgi:hypothetical protein
MWEKFASGSYYNLCVLDTVCSFLDRRVIWMLTPEMLRRELRENVGVLPLRALLLVPAIWDGSAWPGTIGRHAIRSLKALPTAGGEGTACPNALSSPQA